LALLMTNRLELKRRQLENATEEGVHVHPGNSHVWERGQSGERGDYRVGIERFTLMEKGLGERKGGKAVVTVACFLEMEGV